MGERKPSRSEIDRFSGHAITRVSVPDKNKKAIAEIKAQLAKKPASKKK